MKFKDMNNHQALIFTNNVAQAIDNIVAEAGNPLTFVLTDENTARIVLPRLASKSSTLSKARVITIPAGDIHKNIESLTIIWKALCDNGATRHSILINVGGGVITDIGGFAAATFKRGMRFINVPTTLLSAVDAAVGGKTGINFNGFKNEIGAFRESDAVVISTIFFDTLPVEEIRSGYAEMLKHGLIDNAETFNRLITHDIMQSDQDFLLELLKESVMVKRHIVETDPTERGLRRALNLGHTIGHALESLAIIRNNPIPHGYAVAWGCVAELVLSHMLKGFPSSDLYRMADYVYRTYDAPDITCDDYTSLIELMHHDKKNTSSDINFTLLEGIGRICIDCTASEEQIKTALDLFRDLMHR